MRHLEVSKYFSRAFVLLSVTVLAACGGGGDDESVKSPDLPPPVLESFAFTCPNTLIQGLSGQCTGTCVTRSVSASGKVTRTTGCPNFSCQSADTGIVSVESVDDAADTCVIRGVSESTVDVIGTVTGGQATESVQVLAAQVTGYSISPDPVRVPVRGVRQAIATTTFSDGTTDVNPVNSNWDTQNSNIAVVGPVTPGLSAGQVRGENVGNTQLQAQSNLDASQSDTAVIEVSNARLLAGTLCVRPAPEGYQDPSPSTNLCPPFNAAIHTCPTPKPTTSVNLNTGERFVAFGEFDNGTYCDLTQSVTWNTDPAVTGLTIGGADASNPVNNPGLSDGEVLAGDTTGSTNVTARFVSPSQNIDESDSAPLVIEGGGRIASDALSVGIPVEDTNGDGVLNGADDLQKVVCMGAYDLVAGLENTPDLPAAKQVYARHVICQDGSSSGGACAGPDSGTVTPVNATINLVSWSYGGDYFSGGECQTSNTGPLAGDNGAPVTVGNAVNFNGIESNNPSVKGNVASVAPTRLGTACVRGTLSINGVAGSSTDGITAIVLPATSDEVLGDAVQLCNTLVPLFILGGNESSGATIELVAALSDILNPILTQLGDGGLDDGLDQAFEAISEVLTDTDTGALGMLTEPLFNQVVEAIDDGVFSPVNCALGALLQGLIGGDPSEVQALAECAPSGFAP